MVLIFRCDISSPWGKRSLFLCVCVVVLVCCQFHLLFCYHRRDVPAISLLSWGVCVSVVFSLPVVRSDNYQHSLAQEKKKRQEKHSQVPDPSLSLTDKLSGIVLKLHSSNLALCYSITCWDLSRQGAYFYTLKAEYILDSICFTEGHQINLVKVY